MRLRMRLGGVDCFLRLWPSAWDWFWVETERYGNPPCHCLSFGCRLFTVAFLWRVKEEA